MLRERRDERSVLCREHREVCRAIRRLRRLVVRLDHVWREAIELSPVSRQPLTEPDSSGGGTPRRVETRLDERLRQAYVGRDAEPLVNGGPFLEKASVPSRIRQDKLSA